MVYYGGIPYNYHISIPYTDKNFQCLKERIKNPFYRTFPEFDTVMRILIIGGTRFSGLRVSIEALKREHHLTIFHRGQTTSSLLDGIAATVIIGDRDKDLSGLRDGEWDITIDMCAYRPIQIARLKSELGARAGRYILISSISVYSESNPFGCDEANVQLVDLSPVVDKEMDTDTVGIDELTYGPLKVLCEQQVSTLCSNYLIIRPSYIIGPNDFSMRFPTWVQRIQDAYWSYKTTGLPIEVEAPSPASNPMQFIDARDLAMFILNMAESDIQGEIHTAMPEYITFEKMLDVIRYTVYRYHAKDTDSGDQTVPDYVHFRWLPMCEVKPRMLDFPMWEEKPSALMRVNSAKAVGLGLQCRPLHQSVVGVLDWLAEIVTDSKK